MIASMAAAATTERAPTPDLAEERMLIYDVPWATYVVLRDSLDDQGSKLHLTYLDGTLELMSPSKTHEETKKLIARLVEAYGDAMGLDLTGRGSETYRQEKKKRGLEADECYSLGPQGDVPDLAIEVVYSKPKLDKLEVYRGLGVPEVWRWENGALHVFVLEGDHYEEATVSRIFPALDLARFASFVRADDSQAGLVRRFRETLGAR